VAQGLGPEFKPQYWKKKKKKKPQNFVYNFISFTVSLEIPVSLFKKS
jgi:hypothetical protein